MQNRLIQSLPTLILCVTFLFTGCQAEPGAEAETAPETEHSFPNLTEAWRLETGLDRPESAIFDAARNVIYVTNLVGGGDAIDGDGYIAKISPAGEIIEERWIEGLNAPKGIAIAGNTLWASDINRLVEIDLSTEEIANTYSVEGDAYLNDVGTHPDGSVFVSDSRFSKIYKFSDGRLEIWLEDPQIQMPNGVHVIGDELVVVAGDADAENPGQARYFQAISLTDKSIRTLEAATPDGALDAVEPTPEGGIFTTDWAGGRLMYFKEGEGTTLLRQLGAGTADLDYIPETGMLYLPVMQEGQLIAFQVE